MNNLVLFLMVGLAVSFTVSIIVVSIYFYINHGSVEGGAEDA